MYITSVYTEGVMIAIICEALALLLSDTSSHKASAGAGDCSLCSVSVCVYVSVWNYGQMNVTETYCLPGPFLDF